MSTATVTQIRENVIYDYIKTFLESRNENTRKGYTKDIEYFFEIIKGKNIKFITEDDLCIKLNEVEKFRLALSDKGEANTTINRRVAAIKRILNYLKSNDLSVKTNFFSEIKDLPERPDSYDVLSPDEAFEMANIARQTEREKKHEKYFFIMTAIYTSIRLDALSNIKWSKIREEIDCYVIQTYDKNNQLVERSISKEFYEELTSIKKEGQDSVFKFTPKGVSQLIKRLCERMGIPEERNIKFHSLRKTGINHVYDVTGDLNATLAQSGHKNIQVLYDSYIKNKKDYSQMAGILMSKKLNEDILEELSKEKLVQVIKECSYKTKAEIIRKAEKLL